MGKPLQAVRGMHAILPSQTPVWQYLENTLQALLSTYGYQEIRLPIVESTAVFNRSIGASTDIVEKEMYTFTDRNGDSLALRPEATAGCVRAGIEHGLLFNQCQRLWTMGPMFRHERPQKGRYRQFHQVSVEAFGMSEPAIDAELILLTARLWQQLGLIEHVTLELNTLGSLAARQQYRAALTAYLTRFQDDLDEDSRRRLATNPLRILDSKDQQTQRIIADAPVLSDYVDAEAQAHFRQLTHLLDRAGISYRINPRLVRGLDYYNNTVFEWVTDHLGAQGTVCAGGRYDGLVALLGGKPTPAVGCALGLERLILLLERLQQVPGSVGNTVAAVLVTTVAMRDIMPLIERIRDACPTLTLQVDMGGGSFKAQLRRADRSGARYALIIGEEEFRTDRITVKFLRQDKPQIQVNRSALSDYLQSMRATDQE